MGPISIALEASTVCQLKCPSCPTAKGIIKETIGSGFLDFNNFKKLIELNPRIAHIELSSWGEPFLNPYICDIIEHAYKKNVVLTAGNGTNLNTVKENVLVGLVKHKFFFLNCSIDGVSQKTYEIYRREGKFAQVIENIKKINFYKAKYHSILPLLQWQYIVFGHNEHEIGAARKMAKGLGMKFFIKLNANENYSPVKNKDLVRRRDSLKAISRTEYFEKYGKAYFQPCHQLWNIPQINWDGRMLGCCNNYKGDFGNVFISGIENSLAGKKMKSAKQMLLGKNVPEIEEGIPCSKCKIYEGLQKKQNWLTKTYILGRSRIAMQCIYYFIHKLGWKKAEILLKLTGSYIARSHQKERKSSQYLS